jgi:hypothetical protein
MSLLEFVRSTKSHHIIEHELNLHIELCVAGLSLIEIKFNPEVTNIVEFNLILRNNFTSSSQYLIMKALVLNEKIDFSMLAGRTL